jgi:hypothetical protein
MRIAYFFHISTSYKWSHLNYVFKVWGGVSFINACPLYIVLQYIMQLVYLVLKMILYKIYYTDTFILTKYTAFYNVWYC